MTLTSFANLLLAGRLPKVMTPFFCGAKLFGAKKKSGRLCPIVVGDVFCRLTSKCAVLEVSKQAAELLAPLQLGVGIKGGCGAPADTVRAIVEDLWEDLMVKCDFMNAFNEADRVFASRKIL